MIDPGNFRSTHHPRVVVWGLADFGKPRCRILVEGLRRNGVDVVECTCDVWAGVEDKSQLKGASGHLKLALHALLAWPRLLWRYLFLPRHDWVLVCYPAILDIFVIRIFAWLRGSRVAMDWFLSAYDTVVCDRGMIDRRNPLSTVLWAFEWLAVRLADRPFMDTVSHARRMEHLFGLQSGSCGSVWVGAEDPFFQNRPSTSQPADRSAGSTATRVLFYGQFIPLHGTDTIIAAAELMRREPVEWTIVGTGQEAERFDARLRRDPGLRIERREWVAYRDLITIIDASDICLGIFGTSEKAASVIPNKVFQILAMGKTLITSNSPAISEMLSNATPGVLLVPPGDPDALAEAIRRLARSSPPQPRYAREDLPDFDAYAIGQQLLFLLGPAHDRT